MSRRSISIASKEADTGGLIGDTASRSVIPPETGKQPDAFLSIVAERNAQPTTSEIRGSPSVDAVDISCSTCDDLTGIAAESADAAYRSIGFKKNVLDPPALACWYHPNAEHRHEPIDASPRPDLVIRPDTDSHPISPSPPAPPGLSTGLDRSCRRPRHPIRDSTSPNRSADDANFRLPADIVRTTDF